MANDEPINAYPIKMNEQTVHKRDESSDDYVNSQMVDLKKVDDKPDYHEIATVPITLW